MVKDYIKNAYAKSGFNFLFITKVNIFFLEKTKKYDTFRRLFEHILVEIFVLKMINNKMNIHS